MRSNNIRTIFLKLFLVIMACVMTTTVAYADTWDGTTPGSWADAGITGSGTKDDPYVINSAKQLAYFGYIVAQGWSQSSAYWKLGTDVNLNSKEWSYGKNNTGAFKGSFDGDGHAITNLKVVNTLSWTSYGFFTSLEGAVVDNLSLQGTLTISTAPQSGNSSYGLLAGIATNSVIKNCKVAASSTITLSANVTSWLDRCAIGGLIGYLSSGSSMESCISKSLTITTSGNRSHQYSNFSVGGLVGESASNATIKKSGSTGLNINMPVTKSSYDTNSKLYSVGGVVGIMNQPQNVGTDLYFDGQLRAEYASVGPITGNFSTTLDKYTPAYYSGEKLSNPSESELDNTDTWHYNTYKLYVTSTANSNSAKNYTGNASNAYLTVTDNTFKSYNSLSGTTLRSRTVLKYTSTLSPYFGQDQNSFSNTNNQGGPNQGGPGGNNNQRKTWSDYMYYTYYMQGLNGGTYVDATTAAAIIKEIESGANNIKIVVEDEDEALRGTGEHTVNIKVTSEDTSSALSWQCYVDDVATGAANATTLEVAPTFSKTRVIKVVATQGDKTKSLSFTLARALLDTKDHTSVNKGTESNPYIIYGNDDLRMLSEYTNMTEEITNGNTDGTKDGHTHFNTAYYELGGDIVLTSDDFTPLCSMDNSRYAQEYAFTGHFDGKGYSISGLRQGWRAGDILKNYDENPTQCWGLFGVVGGGSSVAVIQNLIISDAMFTHDETNTSFISSSYDWISNNCAVGVLAGMVTNNSTIQNIDVRNSNINDASVNYTIATSWHSRWLWTGGVIGRVQQNYATTSGDLMNITLRYLSSHTDITLQHAVNGGSYSEQYMKINVGGIVGSIEGSGAASSLPIPQHTFYTGKVKATNSAGEYNGFVGPVYATVFHANNTGVNPEDYCSHYAGPAVATGYYNKYYINYNGTDTEVTNEIPTNTCSNGARTFTAHTHSDIKSYMFQGVNQGEYNNDADVVQEFEESQTAVGTDIPWGWDDTTERPVLNSGNTTFLKVTEAISGATHTFTAEMQGVEAPTSYTYTWYNNNKEVATGQTYTATQNYHEQKVYCVATKGDEKYTSSKKTIASSVTIKATLTSTDAVKSQNGDVYTYEEYKKLVPSLSESDYYLKDESERLKTAAEYYDSYTEYNNLNKDVDGFVEVTEEEYKALSDADKIKTPAVYYTYEEYCENNNLYVYAATTEDEYKNLVSTKDSKVLKPEATRRTLSIDMSPVETELTSNSFTVTYAWYNASNALKKISENSSVVVEGVVGSYYCIVTVTDNTLNNKVVYNEKLSISFSDGTKYYVNPSGTQTTASDGNIYPAGNDSNDGLSPETAVKTWSKVYSLLDADGTWDDNIIVLMGESSESNTRTAFGNGDTGNTNTLTGKYSQWWGRRGNMNKNATITGNDGNRSYNAKLTVMDSDGGSGDDRCLALFGDTKFENLEFNFVVNGTNGFFMIACQYFNLEMGKGLKFSNFKQASTGQTEVGPIPGSTVPDFQIFGGCNNDNRFVNTVKSWEEYLPHPEGFKINIKSGFYSAICVGGRQSVDTKQNGICGTPNMPIKCTITVDIDREQNDNNKIYTGSDYDIGCILAGNHEGAMYADVDMVVKSGIVGRLVCGTLGNKRLAASYGASGGFSGTYNDVTVYFPFDSYYGRANILIDPASSENNSNTDVNGRVVVTEVYGGALGRCMGQASSHGQCMSTFYGKSSITINGGTFRVPSNYGGNTASRAMAQPGIYGGGAGGFNGIGNDALHTNDIYLPYWKTDNTGNVHYAAYDTWKGMTGEQKVYIKCYDGYDNTGATKYTQIDPAETSSTITIKGGVFTSDLGGIYGGGNGYVNNSLINISSSDKQMPNVLAGSILAGEGKTAIEMNISGGTFDCNVYGGSKGNDYYYTYNKGSYSYGNKLSNTEYTSNAQILGNTILNITGGTFNKNVYGAGYGSSDQTNCPNMAKLTGSSTINISQNAQIFGSVFGGGEYAQIDGSTEIELGGGTVYTDVYGGGDKAKVSGSTTVYANNSTATVYGDMYGGGSESTVGKNTYVGVSAGSLAGQLFGGGKGTESVSADVVGNTEVFVNGLKVLWNQMYDADTKSTITWTPGTENSENYKKFNSNTLDAPVWVNQHNVYGGGNVNCTVGGTAKVTVTKGMTPKELLATDEWMNSYNTDDQPHFYVFGGGLGEKTSVQNTDVNVGMEGYYVEDATTDDALAKYLPSYGQGDNDATHGSDGDNVGIYGNGYGIGDFTVLGVIGGGFKGQVVNNTDVNISGSTFIHRVYGGGYGDASMSTADAATTLGLVGNNTNVTTTGGMIYGDIFAGGARGNVKKKTYATIKEGTKVYGSVYGGGDVAYVGTGYTDAKTEKVTNVDIMGGIIYDAAFAGGKNGPVNGSSYIQVRDTLSGDDTVVPYIYGNIYGGGEKANVLNNTVVDINGGSIAGDIFGGGLGDVDELTGAKLTSADVAGSTNVNINGGRIMWDELCNDALTGDIYYFDNSIKISAANAKKGIFTAEELASVKGFLNIDTTTGRYSYINNHNVYGGGNHACVVSGTANVTVKHGMVEDGLTYYDSEYYTPFALAWYKIMDNKSQPQFSVLGGGYGEHTSVAATNVDVQMGTEDENATSVYASYYDDVAAQMQYETEMQGRWAGLTEEDKNSKYGGTNVNGYRRYRASRYAWSGGMPCHTILNIIGGSWKGTVNGNTNVKIDGISGCRNVFGGGIGTAPTDMTKTDVAYGKVGGTANVTINAGIISGSVFGGGAGVESKLNGNKYYDYADLARVQNAVVNIDGKTTYLSSDEKEEYPGDGTLIYGEVYGGGDVASVGETLTAKTTETGYKTAVTIKGGVLMSQVYAGGSGRKASICDDYTKLGAVYGNTHVLVDKDNDPWLFNRVYGGGQNGSVFGNTTVDIKGGHFGYNLFGGGLGVVEETENGGELLTDAKIYGNTNVNIDGGEYCLSQIWTLIDDEGNDVRAWAPMNTYNGQLYSAQYDPETTSMIINHNVYGGGNACCTVVGNAYVKQTKGLLSASTFLGHDYTEGGNFFSEKEWKEIYYKVGSSHFTVYGGGYGKKTTVANTWVDIVMDGDTLPTSAFHDDDTDNYKRFYGNQSLLDVYGGGYNGVVTGDANVHVGGNTFLRRAFGGGYFSNVGTATLDVMSGDMDNVYGGGMMGDVLGSAKVNVGRDGSSLTFNGTTYASANEKLFVNENVYGGNDVSGNVNDTHVTLRGGNIYGNVYGGGNGDYLYALGVSGETSITPNEHYLKKEGFEGYDLVYTVPMRDGMAAASSASDAQKIVNINTYRPEAVQANIDIAGTTSNTMNVSGNIFGGGNSATIFASGSSSDDCKVNIKIGSHINVGGIYLGSDGDALFQDSENNPFLSNFQTINSINLEDTVKWMEDAAAKAIKEEYLPVKNENRTSVYPHLLDLYFQPVEMSVQPTVEWATNLTDCTIGTFVCGGNRGNMNVYPGTDGKVVDIEFPAGLTIKEKIVGGCNNANYIWHNSQSGNTTTHTGGYLLGSRSSEKPMINLTIKNSFSPYTDSETDYYTGSNVYGGCYKSGTINGGVAVDLRANMLKDLDKTRMEKTVSAGNAVCNVYGAGYGTDSYVYGNVCVEVGKETVCKTATMETAEAKPSDNVTTESNTTATLYADDGTSANYVYGGGLLGNVVGNTTVNVYNGHILHAVTGGSYAGYQWGSTQVLVGYPEYYIVKNQGTYNLLRKDLAADNLALMNTASDGTQSQTIKQTVKLMPNDIISTVLYDAIKEKDASQVVGMTKKTLTPADVNLTWDDIDINIGDAVYGGGYSLASGTSQLANNVIVLKYDNNNNVDDSETTAATTTVGYGGNTTVLVWDANKKQENSVDKDHISISTVAGEGGIFGDGHLSYAEGFRNAELQGYGYAGTTVESPKRLNTFQRLDILRLKDNCLLLHGARDYATNATNSTLYSISRVGEIQMISSIADDATLVSNIVDGAKSRIRNYMGMENNIHYVGALYSNTAFTDQHHGIDGVMSSDKTYRSFKEDYIKKYYSTGEDKMNEGEWQKRNAGTSRNLVGIASGYALKIQNLYETYNGGKVVDNLYYGPINGVVEVKLIDAHQGEGGGYIYADNIHDSDPVTFLETTGNFVFQYDETDGRYIIDDCFPDGYDAISSKEKGVSEDDIHYWYVTGYNFYYHTQITGYTYDSSKESITFNNDNSDGLILLNGLKSGQLVQLFKWWNTKKVDNESGHNSITDNDDLMGRNYDGVIDTKSDGKQIQMEEDSKTCGHYDSNKKSIDASGNNVARGYQLDFGISSSNVYDEATLKDENGVHGTLPMYMMTDKLTSENLEIVGDKIPTMEGVDLPRLSFRLIDKVNNKGKAYYDDHMKNDRTYTLIFDADAYKEYDASDKTKCVRDSGFIAINQIFYKENNGTFEQVNFTGGSRLEAGATYYYKNSVMETYTKVPEKGLYVKDDEGNYNTVDLSNVDISTGKGYYVYDARVYTYTIELTISYVQGPNLTGKITIDNCALPGEMIRILRDNINVESDESMSATGVYWRVGQRKKNDNGYWEFVDNTAWSDNSAAGGYDSYMEKSDKKQGVFKGAYIDEDNTALMLPAYYYMNGYGVQIGMSFNGLTGIFPVDMQDEDVLTVHNYQLMDPHSNATSNVIDLHIAEAMARAKAAEEGKTGEKFARPRIYLTDEEDIDAFRIFVDSVGRNGWNQMQIGNVKCEVPTGGAYAQFYLLNNVEMKTYIRSDYDLTAMKPFQGIFDGMGHTLDFTNEKHKKATSFLDAIMSGKVYNLGVVNLPIATNLAKEDDGNAIGEIHNSFVYGGTEKKPMLCVKEGETADLDNCYDLSNATVNDFAYGKVAYNLNMYYLQKRYQNGAGAMAASDESNYLDEYYRNGDYQYAHRSDDLTGQTTGIVYLRKGTDDIPAYGSNNTRHDKTHAVDEARAVYVTVGDDQTFSHYQPLFNETTVGTAGDNPINDYIVYGQDLTRTSEKDNLCPSSYPTAITSRFNSHADNRVWRASGFYGSKKDEGFYFNGYRGGSTGVTTYIHDPALTAVDFTCQRDGAITNTSYHTGMSSVDGEANDWQSVYYAPTTDVPSNYWGFNMGSEAMTPNILVYTKSNTNINTAVSIALNYTVEASASDIKGHQVVVSDNAKTATYLHLVDKQNMNVPIEFTVGKGWYERNPGGETGYADDANSGWESICLPFEVASSTLAEGIQMYEPGTMNAMNSADGKSYSAENGEAVKLKNITFFYGSSDKQSENPNLIGHEYWLRKLTNIEKEGSQTQARFKRPANAIDDEKQSGFEAYVPFIVSFPGSRFYEFNMADAGDITFTSKANATVAVTDIAIEANKSIAKNNSLCYYGAFANEEGSDEKYAIAMGGTDDKGKKFTNNTTIYPFRAYLAQSATTEESASAKQISSLLQQPDEIYIVGTVAYGEQQVVEEQQTEDVITADGLRIYPNGSRIIVESTYATTLPVYSSAGQLVRLLDVRPGKASYSGFNRGIYIVADKKIMLK